MSTIIILFFIIFFTCTGVGKIFLQINSAAVAFIYILIAAWEGLRYWQKMHFGHKSRAITLLFLNEIIPLAIPYHSSPIPMTMQSLKKIGKKTKVRARKRSAKHFWHTSRAITLLFQNEISPHAIPYHSSPIPMSMQSLKKIGQKVLKLEHGNEALMDRQMDRRICFWMNLPHLQSHITPLRYQCLYNAYAKFYWNSSIHS